MVAQCTWDPGRTSENNHVFILHEFTLLILQLHQLIFIPNTVWWPRTSFLSKLEVLVVKALPCAGVPPWRAPVPGRAAPGQAGGSSSRAGLVVLALSASQSQGYHGSAAHWPIHTAAPGHQAQQPCVPSELWRVTAISSVHWSMPAQETLMSHYCYYSG